MQLGSGIAVAVVQASTCSSDLTSRLGTSICTDTVHRRRNVYFLSGFGNFFNFSHCDFVKIKENHTFEIY